jgi:hypothetical protein
MGSSAVEIEPDLTTHGGVDVEGLELRGVKPADRRGLFILGRRSSD